MITENQFTKNYPVLFNLTPIHSLPAYVGVQAALNELKTIPATAENKPPLCEVILIMGASGVTKTTLAEEIIHYACNSIVRNTAFPLGIQQDKESLGEIIRYVSFDHIQEELREKAEKENRSYPARGQQTAQTYKEETAEFEKRLFQATRKGGFVVADAAGFMGRGTFDNILARKGIFHDNTFPVKVRCIFLTADKSIRDIVRENRQKTTKANSGSIEETQRYDREFREFLFSTYKDMIKEGKSLGIHELVLQNPSILEVIEILNIFQEEIFFRRYVKQYASWMKRHAYLARRTIPTSLSPSGDNLLEKYRYRQ